MKEKINNEKKMPVIEEALLKNIGGGTCMGGGGFINTCTTETCSYSAHGQCHDTCHVDTCGIGGREMAQ